MGDNKGTMETLVRSGLQKQSAHLLVLVLAVLAFGFSQGKLKTPVCSDKTRESQTPKAFCQRRNKKLSCCGHSEPSAKNSGVLL